MLSRCSLIQGPRPGRGAKSAPAPDSRRYFHAEEADTPSSKARFFWSLDNTSLASPGGGAAATEPSPLPLQPKLHIGAVDDPLEREADRMADRVMRMPEPGVSVATTPEQISRKCAACQQEDENTLQAKPSQSPSRAGEVPLIVHDALRAPGQPLDRQTRMLFESRFHRDFGGVRVHIDEKAARSADSVGAMAYTVGSHIVFGSGRFAPGADPGKRLLAHELAHVVQQAGHGASPTAAASPVQETSSAQALMRTPLLSSTLQVCKRVLKGEHVFHVSDGGIIVTANARWEPSEEWQGEERPKCGIPEYHITLSDNGRLYDSEYGTCSFAVGSPFSRQWTNLPEKDYYLVIWTDNTNPNCCLEGEIEVSQEKGLTGQSCTRPPPGPLEILHDALTIAGLVPALGAIPDAINAGIYIVEGDWANAGISAIAIIPIFGEAASVVKIGEKEALRVGGEAVTKAGKEEIAVGLKEAKAAQAAKEAKEAQAAKQAIEGAEEIKLSQAEYEAALKMVFPSQYVDEVAKLVDDIGQGAAKRAMENPRFVQAMQDGNMTLAGTFFHSAAAQEARSVPAAMLPKGWALEAEKTIQSGAGGSRADILLRGPGADVVEFDWKTTGRSALSSGSRKEMARHAGQITVNIGGKLTTQQSRSWMDYVRPLL